ncbi:MAG: C39 family peptidase [Bacteroidetes bacterium]|nr:C39 family peptidase [Bacteroidota bacterium]MBP7400292.1 C39 family peptidase [Chitinophagales bacterium]MBK7110679.1 C39 family peptidase [Bacteroidota bacterium]MBK8488101.1 C39 family peptidase [Bacteroidota bacterium]MBK8682140.1 C39 family peptidase [Bacteroidota bacterium]
MKKLKLTFLLLLSVSIGQQIFAQQSYTQEATYVGILSENFNYYASSQRNSNWCWAASLQMIFNYYGINITQEQIVERSYGSDPYGNLPNWTGNFEVITANLNNWNVDNNGRQYEVYATLNFGAPTPSYLIEELANQHPVLIGYQSSPNSGHAVVITACSYLETDYGPMIQSIVVRDPWPNEENSQNGGRVEYPGIDLANLIQAHWYIRVN